MVYCVPNKDYKSLDSNTNDALDVKHLAVHLFHKRHFFITADKKILEGSESLRAAGIKVMNSEDCWSLVNRLLFKNEIRLNEKHDSSDYSSPDLSGKVSFNYSNNNGRYTIGLGPFLFETKWSKASNKSIHCCNDPPSIREIAIIENTNKIQELKEADFSSRCRAVELDSKPFVILRKCE